MTSVKRPGRLRNYSSRTANRDTYTYTPCSVHLGGHSSPLVIKNVHCNRLWLTKKKVHPTIQRNRINSDGERKYGYNETYILELSLVFLALIVSVRHILGYYKDRRCQHLYTYMYVWDVYRYCYYCRTVESIVTYSSTIASFKEKIRLGQLVGARAFRHGCPRSASSYIFRPRVEGEKERKTVSEWMSEWVRQAFT